MGEAQSKSAKARRETSQRAPLTDLSNTSPSSSPPPPSRLKGKQKENMAEAEPTPIEARRVTSERAPLTDLSNTSPSPSLPSSPHLKEKHKENMAEAESTPIEARRETNERTPLADLSNTSPSSLFSSQSSSPSFTDSLSKYSFSWARKHSLDKNLIPSDSSNTNSKLTFVESSSNNDDNNQKQKDKGKQKEKGKSQGNKENPGSARSPFPKTPSVSGSGVGSEPRTVYIRKRPNNAEKRKNKGKEIAEPLTCLLQTKMADLREKKDEDGNIGLSKSCPLPHKKKQRRVKTEVNATKHDLPQDFLEKQRAYFAEVDAFELEEEVQSSDELE